MFRSSRGEDSRHCNRRRSSRNRESDAGGNGMAVPLRSAKGNVKFVVIALDLARSL
jgi:hypothetical protein